VASIAGDIEVEEAAVLLNGWIAATPEEHRAELISRMQHGGNEAFGAALCELLVATFLTKFGLKLVFHPDVPGSSNHPDFAVFDEAGKTVCYVEVTTINRAAERGKEQNREAVRALVAVTIAPRACRNRNYELASSTAVDIGKKPGAVIGFFFVEDLRGLEFRGVKNPQLEPSSGRLCS
jgi:hypothetical protein